MANKKLFSEKYVSALPTPLGADTLYYVRTGTGFDIYLTNSSGTVVAYPLNPRPEAARVLTYAGTLTINAAETNKQSVVLTGNVTFGPPTNPTDMRCLVVATEQGAGGSKTVTFSTAAGGFFFPSGTPPVASTVAGAVDHFGFIYNAGKEKWMFQGMTKGS